MIRTINRTVKLDIKMEKIFPKTKTPNTNNINFLRLIPENNNGIVGPDIAIAIAKRLNVNPAVDILTLK